MERVNADKQAWRGGDSGVKYMMRGPRLDWGLVKFKPGEELGAHYHKAVEETFYFPEGAPKMIVAGSEIRVRPGDAVRVEPGETHNIINDTFGDVTAVFIKCPYDPDDKVAAK
jgi:mannose-6-phosphate isomerase-like protein (cupin superfamily)